MEEIARGRKEILTNALVGIRKAKPPAGMTTRIVAVDGAGGAGKTSLSEWLASELGAAIVHTDDFASWENPTNWWPELIDKVLKPIASGSPARFVPTRWGGPRRPEVTVEPRDFLILEGVTASREAFRPYLTYSIWIETPRDLRLQRGIKRDGEDLRGQWEEWMAGEDGYVEQERPAEHADLVLPGDEDLWTGARQSSETQKFERLAQRISAGGELLRAWKLEGGVSAETSAFEVRAHDGRTKKFVVRLHGERDRYRDPQIAEHEYELLKKVTAAGVPAPKPRFLDAAGEFFGLPALVIDYVDGEIGPGRIDPGAFVEDFASALVEIHRVDVTRSDLSSLRRRTAEEAWQAALAAGVHRSDSSDGDSLPDLNAPVLLHGDYWPGNTLWRNDKLVAVLDWEDAAYGEPLADVANARLELLWSLGVEAMDAFTHRYSELASINMSQLPYWDLWADQRLFNRAGSWSLSEDQLRDLEVKHRAFVRQAVERIA
jgi:aminoglycoside phosphotransferase (APT) family kinase protein/uridine kinase